MPQPEAVTLPMVTVVIPCHNHEAWVLDAINSVVKQGYPRKQIVLSDDGSTDGSWLAVCKKMFPAFTGNLPLTMPHRGEIGGTQIVLLRSDRAAGPAAARNLGIKFAWDYTDLFAFLDSDDRYEPGKLRKSVARWLDAPEHIGAVYSDYDTLRPQSGLRVREFKEPFSRARLLRECLVNCDSLVSKQALKAVGLFDPELRVAEDWDLWLRVSEQFLIVHVPESLVTIRVGDHSSTTTVQQETWQRCWSRVVEKTRARAAHPVQ